MLQMLPDGNHGSFLPAMVSYGVAIFIWDDEMTLDSYENSVDPPCFQDSTKVPPFKQKHSAHMMHCLEEAPIPQLGWNGLDFCYFFPTFGGSWPFYPRHVFFATAPRMFFTLSFQMRHPNVDNTDHTVTER